VYHLQGQSVRFDCRYSPIPTDLWCSTSLDFDFQETRALVTMATGEAHVITTPAKGPIERLEQFVLAGNDNLRHIQPSFTFGGVFTGRGEGILFGSADRNLLVWDRLSGHLVIGLDYADIEMGTATLLSVFWSEILIPLIKIENSIQAAAVSHLTYLLYNY
jgi:hypothetical protein